MAAKSPDRPVFSLSKTGDIDTPPRATDEKSDHASLKHQLLGPSLLKPGQDNVDQARVADIIFHASKGSRYFANESRKDSALTRRIDRILARKAALDKSPLALAADEKLADDLIASLEASRDLSQTVVHVDCDAFYASVEELDRPELRDVPMAVGKGVLTTCNYQARKFGCRSGMAGHIALKLCPQLVFLPLNFQKYSAKAKEVRHVLARYDDRFEAASCDEAYLNITAYVARHNVTPDAAVDRMRREVLEHAKITVSAGIAPNARLAKICSNQNKPNGQFRVVGERAEVMAFITALPVRKVNGIGRVFERELDAVGIKTCGDIYPMRGYLLKLFGQKAYEFLLSASLGLGRTEIRPAEEYIRKSIGSESTFRDCEGSAPLRDRLRKTAESLEEDLVAADLQGRTLALKVKLHTYEEAIRQKPLPCPVWKRQDMYDYALPLLVKLEEEYKPLKIRLMGLRLTNLSSRKKTAAATDFFKPVMPTTARKRKMGEEVDAAEERWEEWPEDEWGKYDDAGHQIAREEDPDDEESKYFDGLDSDDLLAVDENFDPQPEEATPPKEEAEEGDAFWPCPICDLPQPADDKTFNGHVDYCLSKQTIREAVREGDGAAVTPPLPPPPPPSRIESPEKATITAIFKDHARGGSQRNPLPSRRGRPRGKRRKT
ncbi:hypothetical protein Dda_3092 [Drechslerella dactyloides]|uniref:DNA polymerase kappa n=1 Tax=Drechslerella dactyloides TaxID=74499 RepID=A0AAD6NLF9_DREDA|nr:hypothetical protein Dda_3092 [Drechslerella dactyloides]